MNESKQKEISANLGSKTFKNKIQSIFEVFILILLIICLIVIAFLYWAFWRINASTQSLVDSAHNVTSQNELKVWGE